MNRNMRLSTLILCLWAGSLWVICGIVVPGLFWLMPDNKALAGTLAARFFDLVVLLGTLLGSMYWLLRRQSFRRSTSRWLWTAVIAPLVFFCVLRPMMNSLRAAGDIRHFAQLHGIATLLFLLACIGVGLLAWRHGELGK